MGFERLYSCIVMGIQPNGNGSFDVWQPVVNKQGFLGSNTHGSQHMCERPWITFGESSLIGIKLPLKDLQKRVILSDEITPFSSMI